MAKTSDTDRTIGLWLMLGVVMIIIQIILGGITRLTGSGLSITEWKPIMGTLPPLNHEDWLKAFQKYQEIAQFKHLNSHFTLSDFQFIYFWEWFHRLWARILGVAFLIPFLYFAVRGYFTGPQKRMLVVLFLLGALQGLIGWIMVQSGLNDTSLYVNHIKLAIHFLAALVLLLYTFWYALTLLSKNTIITPLEGTKSLNTWILILLGIQLLYGALMAGLKGGVYAPTWPDINGNFFPRISNDGHSVAAWFNEPLAVHFVHRNLAYLITIMIFFWTYKCFKSAKFHLQTKIYVSLPAILVLIQVLLGIFAVLSSYESIPQGWGKFEWNAQLHQLVAILLLMSLVANQYFMRSRET